MTTVSGKQRLDELLDSELGRDNFDELVQCMYDTYASVDVADRHIKAIEAELEDASGEGQRCLAEKVGILHLARGNCAAAAETLWPVRGRKTACHFLGRAYLCLGREREALEWLEKGRSGDDDLGTDVLMVTAHCNLREHEEAEKLLQKHAGRDDEPADLLWARGLVAEGVGEYQEAMDCYESALEKEPEHAESMFRLAVNCDLNGDDERAMELYRGCADLRPTFVGALINLGVLYEDHESYYEAINCYRRVLAIEPTHKQARLYLKDAESSLTMRIDVTKPRRLRALHELFGLPEGDSKGAEEESRSGLASEQLLGNSEMQQLLTRYGAGSGASSGAERTGIAFSAGEDMPVQEKLSVSVDELEFSTRCRRCMERLGVKTVGQLIQLGRKQLLDTANFGSTSLKEVEDKLAALGLSLKGD